MYIKNYSRDIKVSTFLSFYLYTYDIDKSVVMITIVSISKIT